MSPIAAECGDGGFGGRDWEVNQLCDYDVDGDLIATFLQVFTWSQVDGSLTISLVRADDPSIPYVPSGEVRACATVFTPEPILERAVNGDYVTGPDTIIIPDGVISFAVTVLSGGNATTIDGPDFTAPVTLHNGQSIGHAADDGNVLSGPFTITVPAGTIVNATWVAP